MWVNLNLLRNCSHCQAQAQAQFEAVNVYLLANSHPVVSKLQNIVHGNTATG
jgi:hypothetical protein